VYERQQLAAIEEMYRVDNRIAMAGDANVADRLAGDRSVFDRHRQAAKHGYNVALAELTSAEKRCADRIAGLAHVEPLKPLAERLEALPLNDFITYKSLIEDGRLPKEGLNWNSDGCSDRGIVTSNVTLPACQSHDFAYRNNDKTSDGRFIDKVNADFRLRQDLLDKALEDARPTSVLGVFAAPFVLVNRVARAELTYIGVTVGGSPDNTQTDNAVTAKGKRKQKSRNK
jgi:Prokaryotic phospholipase A2